MSKEGNLSFHPTLHLFPLIYPKITRTSPHFIYFCRYNQRLSRDGVDFDDEEDI